MRIFAAVLCLCSVIVDGSPSPLPPPREDEPFATEEHHEIELSNAESLLSRWILEGAPWNSYHSGLLFRNLQTNDTYVIEYVSRNFTSIVDALVPELRPKYDWQSIHGALLNLCVRMHVAQIVLILHHFFFYIFRWDEDLDLVWNNHGTVQMISGIPTKYTKFTKLGILTPQQYQGALAFARTFRELHTTFDPVEVAIAGDPTTRLPSVMCHDFTNKVGSFAEL
jgi:hypothetical protein